MRAGKSSWSFNAEADLKMWLGATSGLMFLEPQSQGSLRFARSAIRSATYGCTKPWWFKRYFLDVVLGTCWTHGIVMVRGLRKAKVKSSMFLPCSCLRLLQVHTFGLTVRSTLVHLRHTRGALNAVVGRLCPDILRTIRLDLRSPRTRGVMPQLPHNAVKPKQGHPRDGSWWRGKRKRSDTVLVNGCPPGCFQSSRTAAW